MMMPMIMGQDGLFCQQYPQQFTPIPMASMDGNSFSSMMMPQLSQPVSSTTVDQQCQQQGQEQVQIEGEQKMPAQEDSTEEDKQPLNSENVANATGDVKRETTSSPYALSTTSSRSSSSPPPSTDGSIKNLTETRAESISPPGVPQNKDTSNDIISTEERESLTTQTVLGTEMTTYSNEPHNGESSKVSSPLTSFATTKKADSPMSPVTNMPTSEEKLFPSPATPPSKIVSKEDIETIDASNVAAEGACDDEIEASNETKERQKPRTEEPRSDTEDLII